MFRGRGEWYNQFRQSLRNPDVRNPEIKKQYQILVDFMDNTILFKQPVPLKQHQQNGECEYKNSPPPRI